MNCTCIKIIQAQQAAIYNSYNTTSQKLLNTNAEIWFNKICQTKQLTEKSFGIKINGNETS